MSYALGIDLGTTYTAAAVARTGRAEVAALGYRATSVPTVVLLTEDGRFLVGDAAERRSSHEPQRVAREFKRRVGDSTPLMLGGTPIAVDRCLAEVLRWVMTTIGQAEGGPPAAVTVTHPANWGEFKRDVLREAMRMVGVVDYRLLAEPVAAATWYAQTERLAPGRTVAVYDLGGGTFDATVLRSGADGQFESLGRTEGIDRLGGIDVDEAVFRYVLRSVGEDAAELAHADEDPTLMAATSQLRRACVEAKEALSSETSVTIPVWLPGVHHEVLLQRAELEDLVGPLLRPTVEALARVVESAGLRPTHLDAVLLVGGSSRIPLISRLVSAEFGRPIAVDAHPKHPVALGAALDADRHRTSGAAAGTAAAVTAAPHGTADRQVPPPPPGPPPLRQPAYGGATGPTSGPYATTSGPRPAATPFPSGGGNDAYGARRLWIAIGATAAVLALIIVLIVMQGGGDDDPPTAIGDTDTTGVTTSEVSQGEGVSTTATAPTTTTATIPPGTNLLTGDAAPVIEALATIYEGPESVYELVLYPEGYANIELQKPGEPTHVDAYTWRDGQITGGDPAIAVIEEGEELQAKMFDLAEVDPAVLPSVAEQTLQQCGEGLELSHMIIDRDLVFDPEQRVLIAVYASNEYSDGGFIEFTLDGTFVENSCD